MGVGTEVVGQLHHQPERAEYTKDHEHRPERELQKRGARIQLRVDLSQLVNHFFLIGSLVSHETDTPASLSRFLIQKFEFGAESRKKVKGRNASPKVLAGCVVAQLVGRYFFFADCAIQNLDHVGFEFHRRGFDYILDGLVTVRDLYGLVVEPCEMLALHEDVRAFDQPVRELGVCWTITDHVVPLSSFAPLVRVFVLPRNLGRDGELGDRRSVLQVGNFTSFSYEP